MKRRLFWYALPVVLLAAILLVAQTSVGLAENPAQLPTVSIATVTGTPPGATARITREYESVNVRSGPGLYYPEVGVLIAGQDVPVLGRSAGGDWLQVAYPGVPGGVAWIYRYLVDFEGSAPIVIPPPTPTPRTTPTVDPTLAAQFLVEIPATRLPTFTAPPPLELPTFEPAAQTGAAAASALAGRIPAGLIISALGAVGLFGMLISVLRGR